MIKATKPEIMRDLRNMKAKQLAEVKEANKVKLNEYKNEIVAKYDQAIDPLVEKLKPIFEEVNKLKLSLVEDSDINMSNYCSSDFISSFTCKEKVVQHIKDRASWYRGSVEVYEDKLAKKHTELENEWDNLLINCSTMTAKNLRQYIEDNKIELPCMTEVTKEETALSVVNVNLDLLFGGNRNDK